MCSWNSSKNHTRSKETDLNRQEIVKIFFKERTKSIHIQKAIKLLITFIIKKTHFAYF